MKYISMRNYIPDNKKNIFRENTAAQFLTVMKVHLKLLPLFSSAVSSPINI